MQLFQSIAKYIWQPYNFIALNTRPHNYWGIPVAEASIKPYLKKLYMDLFNKNKFYNNKFLIPYFAFAYNTWTIVLVFWILFYKKRYDYIIALSIIPAIFITVLLGPTAVIRYIYQNYLILPILWAVCFGGFGKTKTR